MIELTKINAADYQIELNGKYIGDIEKLDDATYTTWFNSDIHLTAKDHREIADKLDELNEEGK
ncbi:MAG: hypothetical protein ABUJ92_00205 [Desulfobacterales bacterium]